MMQSALKFGTLFILSIYVIQCSAIRCFNCTSHEDETCGDPFRQNFPESSLIIDCNDGNNDGRNYTFCRKTVQNVELRPDKESSRVIRSCGFIEEPKLTLDEGDDPTELKCYRRVGTFGVELLYCACYADACNSADVKVAGMGTILFSIFAFLFSKSY